MKNIVVIGGDKRFLYLCEGFKSDGHSAFAYIDKPLKDYSILKNADIIILPLPISRDDLYLNAPLLNEKILLSELFSQINKNTLVFGGKISKKILKQANEQGIKLIDYYNREELIVKNAICTAEGAIMIAMEELPITLNKSDVLILGYGRIAKVLSGMLKGLGSCVCVCARKYSDLALAQGFGLQVLHMNNLSGNIGKYRIIINTVPSVILNYDILTELNKKSLVIDLASEPGGVDEESAVKLGIRHIKALSLPGRVASETSGLIIKETVCNMLNDMEVLQI